MWQDINNHDVYIVDHHHEVLPAWIKACCDCQTALPLITFDYHTDIHKAFWRYPYEQSRSLTHDGEKMRRESEQRLTQVNVNSQESVEDAIRDLCHDEHIDCAIQLNIVSHAFIFLGRCDSANKHPETTIFQYAPCFPGCTKDIHDDGCERPKAELVIDDSVLAPRMVEISRTVNLDEDPYILDIDLDVFNTQAAISPPSADSFYKLIRNAAVITVAREKACVENTEGGCSLEASLTAEYLENKLLEHIAAV